MLELTQIAAQIGDAAQREREQREKTDSHIARAAAEASRHGGAEPAAVPWTEQVGRIVTSRTSWLVAHSTEPPGTRVAPPSLPSAYVVVATDGSQIAPDRHDGSGGCYLLNTGRVFLSYGTGLRSRLGARAEVFAHEETEADDEGTDQKAAADMTMRRFAHEMLALAELTGEASATGLPAVALTDGSLIAWHIQKEADNPAGQEAFAALAETLETARRARTPLAGYVSGPGSRDVVNGLRVTLCPEEPVDCWRCPHPKDALPCAPVRRATDAALFARLLAPGERSAVFSSQGQKTGYSHVLERYGPAHWIAFFYLHVGAEIARIEIPAWVAEDPALVDRVHAICLDQARKGRGYPVALSEAHEQAVVRGAERQAFLNLLQRALTHAGVPVTPTRKAMAKRTRAV